MNRPIEFRAFYEGKMYEVEIDLDGYVHTWIDEDTMMTMIGAVEDERLLKQIPVMQFTGILDKTGVKIFEDDIVRYSTKKESWLARVVYRYGGFWIEYPCSLYEDGYDEDPISMGPLCCEVVGNVWENLDLCEELKNQDLPVEDE